jgi:hypothetical protein
MPRILTLGLAAALAAAGVAVAQPGTARRPAVIIPSLASASEPGSLEFQAGECEEQQGGAVLDCVFQQVFLTVALFDAQTCLITTSRYGRTFRKQADSRWISREAPDGECGVVDEATLEHGGGTRWTLTFRKTVTRPDAAAACRALDTPAEISSWENVRRPLPCRFVQPGAIFP